MKLSVVVKWWYQCIADEFHPAISTFHGMAEVGGSVGRSVGCQVCIGYTRLSIDHFHKVSKFFPVFN